MDDVVKAGFFRCEGYSPLRDLGVLVLLYLTLRRILPDLLRYRARPVSEAEQCQWQHVWAEFCRIVGPITRCWSETPVRPKEVPVRNSQATLVPALRSVMCQTFENWELLLIDDGSTDDTLTIARQFASEDRRIRVYSDSQHLGLPERLNQAIAASQGEYFARIDGDDIAYPTRLDRQVEYLQEHADVDLVGGSVIVFSGNGLNGPDSTGLQVGGF